MNLVYINEYQVLRCQLDIVRLKRCKTYKKRCRDNEKKEIKDEEIHEGGEEQEQGNEAHEEEALAQKVSQEEV